MCIICVSPRSVRQPSESTIRAMFARNPHGAGYMVARDGRVRISKGYMSVDGLLAALRQEHFTAKDPVVYHFRISTQAGVSPYMTHPFPLSNRLEDMRALDLTCQCGIAHNGVIPLTSDRSEKKYSDTALFIQRYLSRIVRRPADLRDPDILDMIAFLGRSKFALLDGSGYIATVGDFIKDRGLLFSNDSFRG